MLISFSSRPSPIRKGAETSLSLLFFAFFTPLKERGEYEQRKAEEEQIVATSTFRSQLNVRIVKSVLSRCVFDLEHVPVLLLALLFHQDSVVLTGAVVVADFCFFFPSRFLLCSPLQRDLNDELKRHLHTKQEGKQR
jgi:hypothetical protein